MSNRPIIIDGPGEYYLRGGGTTTITGISTDPKNYDWMGVSPYINAIVGTGAGTYWHYQSCGSFDNKRAIEANPSTTDEYDIIGKVSKTFISTQPRYMATL